MLPAHALVLLSLGALTPHAAHAQAAAEPHAHIRAAALDALTQATANAQGELRAVKVGLDPHLRLKACTLPLQAALEGPAGRRSLVRVHCPAAGGWTLRVPVQAQLWRPVVVSAVPLVRGQSITANQLMQVEMDVFAAEPGVFYRIEQAIGLEATRNVGAGHALGTRSLAPARLVRRNTPVRIQTGSGPIQVQSSGIALADGRLGETIAVRNARSGRMLSATVVAAGVVEVTP